MMTLISFFALAISVGSLQSGSTPQVASNGGVLIRIEAVNTAPEGTPINLSMYITNRTADEISDSSMYEGGFNYGYSYDIRTDSGTVLKERKRNPNQRHLLSGRTGIIKPGETQKDGCLLTQGFDLPAGRYFIQARTSILVGDVETVVRSNTIVLTVTRNRHD